jgi:hypothetical protein
VSNNPTTYEYTDGGEERGGERGERKKGRRRERRREEEIRGWEEETT